jgi:tRNA(Phe) wybutosine-synthesizing methylase Tyw3
MMDVESTKNDKDSRLFKQQKAMCLSKTDFSRKGSVDERISDLVQFINGCDQYFTTSSCSGRICLFEEPEVDFIVVLLTFHCRK